MRLREGALLSLLLCSALFFTGCGKAPVEERPLLVKTETIGADTAYEGHASFAGTVRGRYETNLSFQIGGRILSRNVEAGSRVNPGDVLMVVDARDAVQQASAGDAQVASARAQLALAQANLARYTELYQAEAVSASVLDQYQTNYDAAFAAYQQALAQAAQAHNAVGYTNLTAGAAGVIASVAAEEGQVVAAGQTVVTLVQTGELEVEIAVPEGRIGAMREGLPVTVSFWALSAEAEGVVREIAPMADSASRTYRVRVAVPAPPEGMALGMTADVRVAADAADGALLPLAAIYQTGDRPTVWIVTDGVLSQRAVTVETFDENRVRVRGLAAGETVVTAGVHKLHEGQHVRTEAQE